MSRDWYPGIVAFCEYWAPAPTLQQTLDTFESEFASGNDACIDASKGLIDCACRTIIESLDDPAKPLKPTREDIPTGELVGLVIRLLGLGDIRDRAFINLVKGHNNVTEALRVLRNSSGTISHGKDGFLAKLSRHHQRSSILAADAIITFLHEAYLEIKLDLLNPVEPYERFTNINELIDSYVGFKSAKIEDELLNIVLKLPDAEEYNLSIEPSRLLFGIDRIAYKQAFEASEQASLSGITEAESA
ncbi:abortive infection family protein [Rhizobium calliandrae]|uniref:Abortive infection family protein n=1 Tax=Rhizobium calliandrae TaxID=1312182 RepID=A0ABT7KP91_9HYPH|nr:abortive infection family protein [Rhizobium calliandrae]MDL2410431.1 abortive infection family protein [Rhizobium calliandrae]